MLQGPARCPQRRGWTREQVGTDYGRLNLLIVLQKRPPRTPRVVSHRLSPSRTCAEQDARALRPATMIIDGEAVVLDEEGAAGFLDAAASLGASGRQAGKRASDATFYAFDLIYFDGHDLRGVEYRSRRQVKVNCVQSAAFFIVGSELVHPHALLTF